MKRFQPWRRIVRILEAVIIIGLPFITINSKSALRFDIPSLQLHFFGINLWMEEFFIVLIAIIFISFLIIFITLLLGRVWCGWVCPQTVIADFTAFVEKMKAKGLLHRSVAYSLILVISIFIAANLIWYFVSPYEFIPGIIKGSLGDVVWSFWIVLTGIIFLNFILLRQKFCATVCPYAKLQSTLFDSRTLTVAFDPRRKGECIECMACVKTCPVGIDIRDGMNAACIHCAECIDRCATIMEPRKKKTLVDYYFGLPGEGGRIVRQNAILLGSVTTAFLIFFIYLLVSRLPIDMTVLPNHSFKPRITSDERVVNSYILSVKNRGKTDVELKVTVRGIEGTVKMVPERLLSVKAGDMKKFPVYVSIKDFDKTEFMHDIDIVIQSVKEDILEISKVARFIIPEDK